MNELYNIVTGPLAWISFLLFFAGSIYKIANWFILAKKSDPFVLRYWSWPHVLASYAHWFNPIGTMRWRTKPVLTAVTFIFHICLVLVPIFLMAHIVMLDQYMGIGWIEMNPMLADYFTLAVIVACVYFIWRRATDRQVAFVTRPSDWFIIAVVTATFATGYLAYHQWGPYEPMLIAHILAGEIFLVMIPFSRVSHMLLLPLTRGYIASEFGAVRKTRDW